MTMSFEARGCPLGTADIRETVDTAVVIRIDTPANPEFWASLSIPRAELVRLLNEMANPE